MAWMGAIGGALIGGLFSSSAADTQASAAQSAADTTGAATRYAADLQNQQYNTTRNDLAPWRSAGTNALAGMQGYAQPGQFSFTPTDFANNQDPGYAFRMSEGLKALDRSAASRGGLLSGGSLKGIQRYGQDMASQEYQNAYGRALTGYNANQNAQNTGFDRLASLAGLGQTANTQIAQAGQMNATNIGQQAIQQGVNQGNANLMTGNANASMYQGLGSAANKAISQMPISNWLSGSSSYNYDPTVGQPSSTWQYGNAY